jgi:hypothetical protein
MLMTFSIRLQAMTVTFLMLNVNVQSLTSALDYML